MAAEKLLINLCETNNVEFNIAVPHNIIGPKQKYDDPFRNVVSIMTNLMLQNRNPIIYGDGEQKRSFSDIEDCIYCLDKLMFDKNVNKQVVNINRMKILLQLMNSMEYCQINCNLTKLQNITKIDQMRLNMQNALQKKLEKF